MDLSHDDCLKVLANPSTQTILESLGYEYSASGLSEYRKTRPNIFPHLVRAVMKELEQHPIFPPEYRDHLPQIGVYIHKREAGYVLMDIDKPSVREERCFATSEGAVRGYVRKILEPYWLESDT